MNRAEFIEMLEKISLCWRQKDYNRAASFFSHEVRYADPLNYAFQSRAELLDFFCADEGFEQKNVWHNFVFDEQTQTGAVEYTYEGTHRYHGVALVKIKNGEITHWREYQHISKLDWEVFCKGTIF